MTTVSKFVEIACMRGQDARTALTYAYRDAEYMVSADGYRLHIERQTTEATESEFVPTKHSDKYGYSDPADLEHAQYPNWRAILPDRYDYVYLVSRTELLHAVELAMIFAKDSNNSVKFIFRDDITSTLSIIGRSPETGDCETAVYAVGQWRGEFEVAYNGQYIIDACKTIKGDTVHLRIHDKRGIVSIINDDDSQNAVIMPMQKHDADRALTAVTTQTVMTADRLWWTQTVPANKKEAKTRAPKTARKTTPTHTADCTGLEYGAKVPIVDYTYDGTAAIWMKGDYSYNLPDMTSKPDLHASCIGQHVIFWRNDDEAYRKVWILRRDDTESFLEHYTEYRYTDWNDEPKVTIRRANSYNMPTLTPRELAHMFAKFADHQPTKADRPDWVTEVCAYAGLVSDEFSTPLSAVQPLATVSYTHLRKGKVSKPLFSGRLSTS